ncbi:DUF1476 domain-containing protein [Roseiterribacter gracilis]|uniref:Aldolase n=1 Tax=Roseiterribacter gracilis TaxID=2812848 RepID=A0A8S8XH75_9PROT|nr:hypothetical protein TMPK1_41310 [Rhodospirillales bacterium TMPK1]
MTSFDDREKAFEAKFSLDEELRFRVHARRARLFGGWIAGQLGLSGDAAESYAKDMISADFEEVGDDDLLAKARADLAAANKALDDATLRKQIGVALSEAKRQLVGE